MQNNYGGLYLSQSRIKSQLEDDLLLIPENYSVHILLSKQFKEKDRKPLVQAVNDVVYAMRVQNLGHYPLEFDVHHAHVSIKRYNPSDDKRIRITDKL